MRVKGPLADSYPAAVVLVVCALTPFLVLTVAMQSLAPVLSRDLHLSTQALSITNAMATAAYACGTVIALQLGLRLRGRRLLVGYAAVFVLASGIAAWAPTAGLFVAARIVQGLCTGLMLIAAVPPLVIGWPKGKLSYTAVVMNLAIFGAVALGPVIGGVVAGVGDWRTLFWIVTGVAAVALAFSLLTFADQGPQDEDAPWSATALLLAIAGSALAFLGSSELTTHSLGSAIVLVPMLAGVGLIVALILFEYARVDALMPVHKLATTLPLTGIVAAMTAGAASVALIELAERSLAAAKVSYVQGAMLFWPEFGGALALAAVFGALVHTRFILPLVFAGLASLAAAAIVLTGAANGAQAPVTIASGLIGLGVGSAVAPGLFLAGFAQRNTQLPRIFAIVELLRALAGFLVAPILLRVAIGFGGPGGIRTADWIVVAIIALGSLLALGLVLRGRPSLQRPELDAWLAGERPALDSLPLTAHLHQDPAARRRYRRSAASAR